MEDIDQNISMMTGNGLDPPDFEVTLLEPRPFRPFKSSEEYLYAMKEDLAEWLNGLYEGLDLDADNFLEQMETGVILCQHANNVVRKAREYYRSGQAVLHGDVPIPDRDVVYRYDVLPETFHARDNVSNFISWCRSLAIKECLLFETDDLVLRKNERSFILCLLEVARRGARLGMPAPLLVQLEQEIDAEIANDDDGYETLHVRQQVVTNDLRSLHQRVVELLSRCNCPSQFPMIRVADGKYRIGDTKVLIFVRILRNHVMVRVGGGWDTLEHYLDKHDPCRCRSGHRLATSAKLTMLQGKSSIPSMHVTYNRPSHAPSSTPSSPQNPRRVLPHMSPSTGRRQHTGTSPHIVRPLPPPCSDDSSTSSPQDTLERKKSPPKVPPRRTALPDGDSSTDEEHSEEDSYKRPSRRRSEQKELVLRDTVPSSWKYSPAVHRKEYQPVAFGTGVPRKQSDSCYGSRLPALSSRTENGQPPKVGKVSPRPHYQTSLNEQRSQSSEDLFQTPTSGPALTKNVIFHSRGPSPVHAKGKITGEPIENSFKRTDPKRHSSPRLTQRTSGRMQLSPPKFTTKSSAIVPPNVRNVHNGQTNRRMFWSPERQPRTVLQRKNSAPSPEQLASPVLEKLLQHSDLCADKDFVTKIEQLIAEFQSRTKVDESDDYGNHHFHSLPVHLDDGRYPKRSPVENGTGKSPSKIPLPTWYSKCL